MTFLAWFIFIGAAILEVGGDAVVRKGLRGSGLIIILIGFAMLGCYGVVVNMVKWDFSKLLGVYVAIFALISILFGRFDYELGLPLDKVTGFVGHVPAYNEIHRANAEVTLRHLGQETEVTESYIAEIGMDF
jgi:hypothetical protein